MESKDFLQVILKSKYSKQGQQSAHAPTRHQYIKVHMHLPDINASKCTCTYQTSMHQSAHEPYQTSMHQSAHCPCDSFFCLRRSLNRHFEFEFEHAPTLHQCIKVHMHLPQTFHLLGTSPDKIDDDLADMLNSTRFTQLINSPTRHDSHHFRVSLLDLINTPSSSKLVSTTSFVGSHKISDHDLALTHLTKKHYKSPRELINSVT